jgi:hypothetical protein
MPAADWLPVGSDLESVASRYANPLHALSTAEIPAILLKRAYSPAHCDGLIRRFIDSGLMRDPADTSSGDTRTRIDIGTSLGNRGGDQEGFFEHAVQTHDLFEHLFDGFDNPVDVIYNGLAALAGGKRVMTAREPDGRRYGPAIFRIHYTHHTYQPHIDHVSLRERRFNYEVSRFEYQFAGVLCFQNADQAGPATQAILHRCLWTEDVEVHIAGNAFHEYARLNNVERCRVDLEQGDLYFFNTRCIHEVPAVEGSDPRIVLAVFIGYSDDDGEIYVWA